MSLSDMVVYNMYVVKVTLRTTTTIQCSRLEVHCYRLCFECIQRRDNPSLRGLESAHTQSWKENIDYIDTNVNGYTNMVNT